MLLRVRRTLITSGTVLMFLVLAGATYQGVATALERRQFRYPGRMVPTGAHQLHIYCRGMGSPTVVLEAPATGLSAAWGWVQPAVAVRTRTCSYDRAGLGWSEMDDRPYDPAAVPGELHTLLRNAGEHPPFVLAGQGLGAAFAKMYASRFDDEVGALVLVDPPGDGKAPQLNQMMRLVNVTPWLARTGVLRATRMLSNNATGMPEPAGRALSSFLNRPDHLTRAARELARWDDAVRLAGEATLNPNLHVSRIEAEEGDRVALLANREQAAHVTAAILSAVDAVRAAHIKGTRR